MGGHDRGEGERWAERAREVLCTQITNVVADNDIASYPPILQRGQEFLKARRIALDGRLDGHALIVAMGHLKGMGSPTIKEANLGAFGVAQ